MLSSAAKFQVSCVNGHMWEVSTPGTSLSGPSTSVEAEKPINTRCPTCGCPPAQVHNEPPVRISGLVRKEINLRNPEVD